MCIYLVIDHRRRQNLEISVTNLAASRDGTTLSFVPTTLKVTFDADEIKFSLITTLSKSLR